MLNEQQRIDDTVQTTARRDVRGFGLRREVPGLRSGQMKLSLQIGSNDVDVAHRSKLDGIFRKRLAHPF